MQSLGLWMDRDRLGIAMDSRSRPCSLSSGACGSKEKSLSLDTYQVYFVETESHAVGHFGEREERTQMVITLRSGRAWAFLDKPKSY